MEPTRIIAFDLSLTAPAVCCDGITDLCDTRKLTGHQRLAWITDWITDWASADGDTLVGIEGYNHGAKFNAHRLGELGGIVRHSLWRRGVPYVDVPPTSIKRYATGKGNANKDAVLSAAHRRSDGAFPGTTNDEADAWWLWALLCDATGAPAVDVPQTHRTVVDAVTTAIEEAEARP